MLGTTRLDEDSWLSALAEDFCWLRNLVDLPVTTDPAVDISPWLEYVVGAKGWRAVLRRAQEACVAARRSAPPHPAAPVSAPDPAGFHCYDCGKPFMTRAQLLSHNAKVHGARRPIRRRIVGTQCQTCLTEFWSRERLVYHAKSARRCSAWYEAYATACSPEEAACRDADAASTQRDNRRSGLQERFAHRPAVRAHGPHVQTSPFV